MLARPMPQSQPQPAPHDPRSMTFVQGNKPPAQDAAAMLRQGLLAARASIPPRFFYDELGSRLFAAITATEEYYPTRTEAQVMQDHLPAIAAALPVTGCTLVDVGAGNCEKAAALFATVRPARYVAVDISTDFLQDALQQLQGRFPAIGMCGVATDFAQRLELPPTVAPGRRLFFYPGSSIGNFSPPQAVTFLQSLREQMHGDGVLWIGVDLQKDRRVLERAYDDSLGVTAAFNRNVLRHVNRIAGTDFDVGDWRHVALYDEAAGRIEMHLEALRDVEVRWPGGSRSFAAAERVHTENSYKYTVDGFERLLAEAGLRSAGCWTDPNEWFGVFVAGPR
jgi:dimethylhistidine N-methyltransferase